MVEKVKNIWDYFKKPDFEKYSFESFSKKIFSFLMFFFICAVFGLLLSLISGIIRERIGISSVSISFSIIFFIIINLLILPIIEEIAFRLPLIFNKVYISLSLFIISYIIISRLYGYDILNLQKNVLPRIIYPFSIASIIYAVLQFDYMYHKTSFFWNKNKKTIFLTFLFIYALMHVNNYKLSYYYVIVFPLIVLPQFISGIFLSFVRIRFGFIFSVIFHFLINLLAILPKIILLLFYD